MGQPISIRLPHHLLLYDLVRHFAMSWAAR